MVPLSIDISEVVQEFELTALQAEELGSSIIDRITAEYVNKWEGFVDKGLRQTRKLYKKAMYVDRLSPMTVEFGLQPGDDGLALAIEEGKGAWDEKPFFANSPKRKTKMGGGWYLTVPFRHATPGAVAEAGAFKSVLPQEIYDIAKNNGGRGVRANQLPSQYQVLGVRGEVRTAAGAVVPAYTHKAPQYQGLVRIEISSTGKEAERGRGGYFTFRRVSDKSDPHSWYHPGFEARKFMDKALAASDIDRVAEMAIDNFLSQL